MLNMAQVGLELWDICMVNYFGMRPTSIWLVLILGCGGNKSLSDGQSDAAADAADASVADAGADACVGPVQSAPTWCKLANGRYRVMPPVDITKLGKSCKERKDCTAEAPHTQFCVSYGEEDPSLIGSSHCQATICELLKCPEGSECSYEVSPATIVAPFCSGQRVNAAVLPCCD